MTTGQENEKAPAVPEVKISPELAEKEVAELSELMELSLAENDELLARLQELENKLKRLEGTMQTTDSEVKEYKRASGKQQQKSVTLQVPSHSSPADSEPVRVVAGPAAAAHVVPTVPAPPDSLQVPDSPAASPVPVARGVFSKKFNTLAYYQMFRTRSRLLNVPPRKPVAPAGPSSLARQFGYGGSVASTTTTTTAAGAAATTTTTAPAGSTAATPQTTSTTPASAAGDKVQIQTQSSAAAASAAPLGDQVSTEEAAQEVHELNSIVESSLQEIEELKKQLEETKAQLEEARNASSLEAALTLFIRFLESNGTERQELIQKFPRLESSIQYWDSLQHKKHRSHSHHSSHRHSRRSRRDKESEKHAEDPGKHEEQHKNEK